jgi:hypothetical protein
MTISPDRQVRTHIRAFFLWENERQRKGLPPDPVADWVRAERQELIHYFSDKAADWAITRYNRVVDFRDDIYEIGNTVWRDPATDTLSVGLDCCDNASAGVNPYSQADKVRLSGEHPRVVSAATEFLGDIHTHIRDEDVWVRHYPSPDDMSVASVALALCDLWSVPGHAPLQISPLFQLVQPNLFGDVFVLEKSLDSAPFTTIIEQDDALTLIWAAYRIWYEDAERRLGTIAFPVSHAAFLAQAQNALPQINRALRGRAHMRLVANASFQPTDPDFVV